MAEEKEDDFFTAKWFRGLVLAAILSGFGSSVSTLNKDTSDRYKGADAAKDFAIRDFQISAQGSRIQLLETQLAAHLQHSAAYTEVIRVNQKELDRLLVQIDKLTLRIRELEKQKGVGMP